MDSTHQSNTAPKGWRSAVHRNPISSDSVLVIRSLQGSVLALRLSSFLPCCRHTQQQVPPALFPAQQKTFQWLSLSLSQHNSDKMSTALLPQAKYTITSLNARKNILLSSSILQCLLVTVVCSPISLHSVKPPPDYSFLCPS